MADNKLSEYSKLKSEMRQKQVVEVIEKMIAEGDKISYYSVAKKSHASKSYLYNNKLISDLINSNRNNPTKSKSDNNSSEYISELERKIRKLEKENEAINLLKQRYNDLLNENNALKQQLKVAYSYSKEDVKC